MSKFKVPEVRAVPVAWTNMKEASMADGEGARDGIIHNVLKR